ncbi:MAG TPA: 3'-5' exonuclease, partial [Acidimicrobiales bacterium]
DIVRSVLASCLDRNADAATPPGPAVDVEIIRTHAHPLFARRYSAALSRLADLEQLQGMAASCATRAAFLAELTLDPPSRTSDLAGAPLLDDDYLILSTIHSAKGSEWNVVYVIHAADGNIPSDMALTGDEGLEEERRLFYVALTRARDHLYVTYPLRYYIRRHALDDVHDYAQPSRFLSSADGLFDEPALSLEDEAGSEVPAGDDTVTSALASLWA